MRKTSRCRCDFSPAESPLLAISGSTDQSSGTTALPPKADLRASMSALALIWSASPPGADVPGGAPVRLLVTLSGPILGRDESLTRSQSIDSHIRRSSSSGTRVRPVRSTSGLLASGTSSKATNHISIGSSPGTPSGMPDLRMPSKNRSSNAGSRT